MATVTKSPLHSSIHRDARNAMPVIETESATPSPVGPCLAADDPASSQYRMILNCSGPIPILTTSKTRSQEHTN
jgi:hypothetical protein